MKTTKTAIARGDWQRSILAALLDGRAIKNPVASLRGKAKNYSGKYEESFRSLLARMRAAGYNVECTLGPHGGLSGATYRIAR